MSTSTQLRTKNGRFSKMKSKAKKAKACKIFIPTKKDEPISPKLKRYIDNRLQHHNDYTLECLYNLLADLQGAFVHDQLEWDD